MRRNKIWLCGILAGLSLCMSACGQNNISDQNNQVNIEPIPTEDSTSADHDTATEGNDTSQNTGNANTASSDNQDGSADADSANGEGTNTSITVTFVEDTQTETADDGTEVYTSTYSYPIIEIADNPEAAKLINADIMERVDHFLNSSEIQEFAKENYELDKEYFIPYGDWLYYGVGRCDSSVISLVIEYISYAGGAHDSLTNVAVNYDSNTGAVLSFSDLSDNEDQFHTNTLEYNQKTASTEEYAEKFFTTDSITNGELENVLYAEDKWYFSKEGLVFISDPYMLGPWVEGTIEFTIPYEDLSGLGMKEIYSHPGPQVEIGDPR